jgi:hypothetical protein
MTEHHCIAMEPAARRANAQGRGWDPSAREPTAACEGGHFEPDPEYQHTISLRPIMAGPGRYAGVACALGAQWDPDNSGQGVADRIVVTRAERGRFAHACRHMPY